MLNLFELFVLDRDYTDQEQVVPKPGNFESRLLHGEFFVLASSRVPRREARTRLDHLDSVNARDHESTRL